MTRKIAYLKVGSQCSRALFVAICLTSKVSSAALSLSDIQSWVGTGSNSAGMVIDFQDGSINTSELWGYHWTGTSTGEQMLRAIISADPHLYALMSSSTTYGTTVFGFGINSHGDGTFPLSPSLSFNNQISLTNYNGVDDARATINLSDQWQEGWYNAGYWSYWTSTTSRLATNFSDWDFSAAGSTSRMLSDGDWDGWSFSRNFIDQAPTAPVLAQYAARVPISVTAGRTFTLSQNTASGILTLAGATGAWTARLDIGTYKIASQSGDLSQLTNQLAEGYNGGTWNGAGGIISSVAESDRNHLTAVGILSNRDANGIAIYRTFGGQPVTTADVLLSSTYYGDANLDGKIDGSDYSLIDNGYLQHLTGWSNGDFNYDGIIDGSDYTLIDNVFNVQASSPQAMVTRIASIPEPSLLAISIGMTRLVCFRHRRPK